jgi:hypothetical protein
MEDKEIKKKLNVAQVFLEAIWLFKTRLSSYIICAVLPIFSMTLMQYWLVASSISSIKLISYYLAKSFFISLMAISFHKISLIGKSSSSIADQLLLDKEKFRFFLNTLYIGVIPFFIFIVLAPLAIILLGKLATFGKVFFWLFIFVALYIPSRVSIILPALAIGEKLSFKSAWRLTEGNGTKIMIVLYLIPVFVSFVKLISSNIIILFIVDIASIFLFLLVFILLSVIYKHLMKIRNAV